MKNFKQVSAWSMVAVSLSFSLAPSALAQNLQNWFEQRSKEVEQSLKRAKPVFDQRAEELRRIAEAEAKRAEQEALARATKATQVATRAAQRILYQSMASGNEVKDRLFCSVKSAKLVQLPDGEVPLFSQAVVLDEMSQEASFDLTADKYTSPWTGRTTGAIRVTFQYFDLPDGTQLAAYKIIPLFDVDQSFVDVSLEQLGLTSRCQQLPNPNKSANAAVTDEKKKVLDTVINAAEVTRDAAQEMVR